MKIVLAYSGGLDTSVAIVWLKEKYDAEIVGFCSDVGQGEDLEAARKKALRTGAVSCHVLDQRDEFVRDFVFPAVRAAAVYEGTYYLGTALARPCIARGMMEVAAREGATAICHGSTGKGNDQVRFELGAYGSTRPSASSRPGGNGTSVPLRAAGVRRGAEDSRRGDGVEAVFDRPNLLHTSYEGGILEDPDAEPPAEMFQRTADPRRAPDEPREVSIGFEKGSPVAVDGKTLGPAALLAELNTIAGAHGVGRADVVEDRFVGMKSRGVYETPGGTLLHQAHRARRLPDHGPRGDAPARRRRGRIRDAGLPGLLVLPGAEALQKMIDAINEPVTGVARLRLYKGSSTLIGRTSPRSLYRNDIVTFEDDRGAYDQRDATGFIRLNALRLRTTAMVKDPT